VINTIDDPLIFKEKALRWAATFETFCYLDSNSFSDPHSKFDCLLAVGVKDQLVAHAGTAFEDLEQFRSRNTGWVTGFLGYDLKNETERLSSGNPDYLNFPDLYFFAPEYLFLIRGDTVEVVAEDSTAALMQIELQTIQPGQAKTSVNIKSRFSKADYIDVVGQIKEHIARGDIYVTNFCQEFYAEDAIIDPLTVFTKLNEVSPAPFSALLKRHDRYVMCASPERFLAKRGNKLISQPMKGTAKRGANAAEDEAIKQELRNKTKEQQENVMIVDLVRNDLTRSALPGTVRTEELFGICSFKQVHQMISTVICEIDPNISPAMVIKNAFPMGSMTGAPKISAMQLMEQFERSKRGVYSGAIGYFSPDGDFDFNVVIRTLLYNAQKKYLSFQAGSAITFHADAEKEYEECLLKAKAIREVLSQF
jgi:para-aminobenzoate synthetase component 1